MIASLPKPSISSINFHQVKSANNSGTLSDHIIESKFHVANIPYSFQLDHISSLFIEVRDGLTLCISEIDIMEYCFLVNC